MAGKKTRKKKTPGRRKFGNKVSGPSTGGSSFREPPAGREKARSPSAATAAVKEDSSIWPSLLSGLLIFLIATPTIMGPYGQKNGYTPDLHMAAYIQVGAAVILLLFWLSGFVRKRMQIVLPRSPLLLPLLLFYGWAMLSISWADSKYEAVNDGLDWSGAFLCGLLVLLLLRDVKRLRTLLFFILVSGLLMALLAVGQYLFGVDWVQQHVVPAATFSNKNMAGQYGVLTLPLAAMFFLYSRERRQIWLFAVALSLISAYILYTRSRGVLTGLLAEAAVFFGLAAYLRFKHGFRLSEGAPGGKAALATAAILFSGLAYLTPATFGNAEKALENSLGAKSPVLAYEHGGEVLAHILEHEQSAETRLTIWGNSVPMFKEHFLIGAGLGNWTADYEQYQSWSKPDFSLMAGEYHANAHNDYIEILLELGVVGFMLLVWVAVSLFRVSARLLACEDRNYFLPALCLTATIAGIAVNAAFSFPLKQPIPFLMLIIYMAVLSNLYGAAVEKGRDYVFPLPSEPVKAGIAAALVAVATGLFVLQYNWYQSELHYRNAVINLQKQQPREAYAEAEQAYAFNPLRKDLLHVQAQYLMGVRDEQSRERGIEILQEGVRAAPHSWSALHNLSLGYNIVGRHADSAGILKKLTRYQPLNFPVKRPYALRLLASGRPEEALKAIELYRRNWQYDYELAEREIKMEEERMKHPDYTEGERFQSWKEKYENKGVRLVQIDKDVEQIKRDIQRNGKAFSETAAEDAPQAR